MTAKQVLLKEVCLNMLVFSIIREYSCVLEPSVTSSKQLIMTMHKLDIIKKSITYKNMHI